LLLEDREEIVQVVDLEIEKLTRRHPRREC